MNLLNIKKVEIGKQIRKYRCHLGLAQTRLAKKLKVSPQFLGHIEKGKIGCPENILKILIQELGLNKKEIKKIFQDAVNEQVDELFGT